MADKSIISVIHDRATGVDESVPAMLLQPNFVARSVNRCYRGNVNRIRPSFSEMQMSFDTPEEQAHFESGNFQGCSPYINAGAATESGILVAIDGVVYYGSIRGNQIAWRTLDDTGDNQVMRYVFAQGEEQVYWQNGVDEPRAWDGEELRLVSGVNKMPVGTLMVYCHGRMVVADELDRVWVSDHFNGAGLGTRQNMDNFSETVTTLGGYFSAPSNMGRLQGMMVAPYADNWFAQGALVLAYEYGFCSLDISTPRADWQDMRVTFTGAGSLGGSLCAVNADIWYLRKSGIGTYRQGRQEFESSIDLPISDEISETLGLCTPRYASYQPMAHFDNRVIVGVFPQTFTDDGGMHVFCDAMAPADLAAGTPSSSEAGVSWDGIWTGIRPSGFATLPVDNDRRMFSFSWDVDSKNRVYEVTTALTGRDVILENGNPFRVLIQSWWESSGVGLIGEGGLMPKKLLGNGKVVFSHQGAFGMAVYFRSDLWKPWYLLTTTATHEPCIFRCDSFGYQRSDIVRTIKTPTIDPLECSKFTRIPLLSGMWYQFRYVCRGAVTFITSVYGLQLLAEPTTCNNNEDVEYSERDFCDQDITPYLLHDHGNT